MDSGYGVRGLLTPGVPDRTPGYGQQMMPGLLTPQAMFDYIRRTPHLAQAFTQYSNGQEQRDKMNDTDTLRTFAIQQAHERNAAADPGGVLMLRRMLGQPVGMQNQLNESHGLANEELRRMIDMLTKGGGQ